MDTSQAYSSPVDSQVPVAPSMATSIRNLAKHYVLKSETVKALRGVSFEIPEGDFVAIMGPSGSGKSTLLNLLGCLDKPTEGSFFLGGDDIAKMTDDQLAEVREHAHRIRLSIIQLDSAAKCGRKHPSPALLSGQTWGKQYEKAVELAERVGLGDRLDHRPNQLSGGQQQRVAIARSLINDPFFVLADEATGNLDSVTTDEILCLFDELNEEGRTIIMVTHEDDVAERAKRIIRLKDGRLHSDNVVSEERREAAREVQRKAVDELRAREDQGEV